MVSNAHNRVDDEPTIRETATQILESVGYEVLAARDGLDGLHAFSKSLPDVIISDLNMPRTSGGEFLAVVRQRFTHIATIAMSGGFLSWYRACGKSQPDISESLLAGPPWSVACAGSAPDRQERLCGGPHGSLRPETAS